MALTHQSSGGWTVQGRVPAAPASPGVVLTDLPVGCQARGPLGITWPRSAAGARGRAGCRMGAVLGGCTVPRGCRPGVPPWGRVKIPSSAPGWGVQKGDADGGVRCRWVRRPG